MNSLVTKVKHLRLTEDMRYRIALVRRAIEQPCEDAAYDYQLIDQVKRELSDEVLALVDGQEAIARAARLRQLPTRAVPAVVELSLSPKRRRRRA